jgi:hypothetical protein
MCCQSYPVPVFLELVAKGDERLYVAAAANDLDDDIELDWERSYVDLWGLCV